MKKFSVEVFFRRGRGVSLGIDVTPVLANYAKETVIITVVEASLEGVRRQIHRQYPSSAYVHVLDVALLEGPLTLDSDPINVVDNIEGTRILSSSIHGYGLFAERVIPGGIVLTELDGQTVSYDFNAKTENFMEWNALAGGRILVRPYRTKYSFINHSRDPNCRVRIDRHNALVVLESITDISPGTELTLDYRKESLPESYISSEEGAYL